MQKYKNILVYIDPEQKTQLALTRAASIIEKQQGGKITLFLCCNNSNLSLKDPTAQHDETIKKNEQWLLELSKPYTEKNINIQNVILFHHSPFEASIIEVLKNTHDLLIKSTHQHSMLGAFLFTPDDWNLLRKCPCPVLLVKTHHPQKNGNILCALDAKKQNDKKDLLNDLLIEEAKSLASIFTLNIHLVNAYPTPPANITIELPELNHIEYADKLKKAHQKTLLTYTKKYDLAPQNIHIEQGIPEHVIANVANEINADLVIIGSLGDSGLLANLLGHTSEQVLDDLNCDLLTLKSEDFESPIKP